MSDRWKGEALARKFRAKTAQIIALGFCYHRIFATAIEEIGIPKLVDALVKAKNGEWAFNAFHHIPDLTKAQRTTLCETIAVTKDGGWAYRTLCSIPDLTEAQRTTLCDVIVATKSASLAYWAFHHIPDLTEAQRSALQEIAQAA